MEHDLEQEQELEQEQKLIQEQEAEQEQEVEQEQAPEENLLSLFSSRARSGEKASAAASGRPSTSVTEHKLFSEKSSSSASSSVDHKTASTRASKKFSANKALPAEDRHCMSPLANAVLREARRQLGSHESDVQDTVSEQAITQAVDRVSKSKGVEIDDIARANIIVHLQRDLLGWGILQPLIEHPEITDIHCYDFRTVVVQRGKKSQTTGIHWPSPETYTTFIDRVLFKLGKSLSNQQHTVDAAFPDGTRICAMHETVCGSRGPLLTIRIPRVQEASLDTMLNYEVAPSLIVNYLAALTRTCEHTIIVAGETGTGKTTLIRCLGSQFLEDESIIGVEDTPEVNYQHPYFRSLVARGANTEGVGEVSLQEHIKATLRLCPTRVVLGEMRTPEAAEAFLEAAQSGHCGMSTIHARNARETLTRLESLLGRVQRGVSMEIIRQQIALAVDVVVWMLREKGTGKIRIAEVLEVGHFIEGQIQIRPMFRLAEMGEQPKWEILSWGSSYEKVLAENGIHLGEEQKYITLDKAQGQAQERLEQRVVHE